MSDFCWAASLNLGFVHSTLASLLWWVFPTPSLTQQKKPKEKILLIPIPEDKISFKSNWKEELWQLTFSERSRCFSLRALLELLI